MLFVEGYRGRKGEHLKVPNNLVGNRTGNGEIHTGYYADFFQLSKADQATVWDERKQVGKTTKGRGNNAKKPAGIMDLTKIPAGFLALLHVPL